MAAALARDCCACSPWWSSPPRCTGCTSTRRPTASPRCASSSTSSRAGSASSCSPSWSPACSGWPLDPPARARHRCRRHSGPRGRSTRTPGSPERNIDRYEQTGDLDVRYLQSLSADAAPVIAERLPERVAACVLQRPPGQPARRGGPHRAGAGTSAGSGRATPSPTSSCHPPPTRPGTPARRSTRSSASRPGPGRLASRPWSPACDFVAPDRPSVRGPGSPGRVGLTDAAAQARPSYVAGSGELPRPTHFYNRRVHEDVRKGSHVRPQHRVRPRRGHPAQGRRGRGDARRGAGRHRRCVRPRGAEGGPPRARRRPLAPGPRQPRDRRPAAAGPQGRRPRVGQARGAVNKALAERQVELEAEHEERMLVEETVDVTLPDRPGAVAAAGTPSRSSPS